MRGVYSLSRANSLTESQIVAIAKMASTSMSLTRACKVHAVLACSIPSVSSAFLTTNVTFLGQPVEMPSQRWSQRRCSRPGPVTVRAEEVKEVTQAKGLSRESGGQWLSCTTRHVRIYAGYVDPETQVMDQSQLDKLTLMLDPDNEFEWPEEMVEKVYDKYRELVETYAVSPLNPTSLMSSKHPLEA